MTEINYLEKSRKISVGGLLDTFSLQLLKSLNSNGSCNFARISSLNSLKFPSQLFSSSLKKNQVCGGTSFSPWNQLNGSFMVAFLFSIEAFSKLLPDHCATFSASLDTDDLLPQYFRSDGTYLPTDGGPTVHGPHPSGPEIRVECRATNYEFSVYKNFSTDDHQIWRNRVFQLKL